MKPYIYAHLFAVVFYQGIVMFQNFDYVLSAKSCGNVKVYNTKDGVTALNITACGKSQKVHNRIVDQELSWSQAMASCKTMELAAVDASFPSWASRIDVRNYLEEINYKNLNYTFWFGAFRPHLHVRKWYTFRGACKECRYINPPDPNNGQCAVIQRNESDNYRESILAEDCNKRYPYVCSKYDGCNDFLAYIGFDVTVSPLGAKRINILNVSFNVCKSECYDSSVCNSFSYANVSRACTLFKRRSGYGSLNYTINISNTSDVTHYAKTDCIVDFMSNTNDVSESNGSLDLPDCGIDEVPPSYCPCKIDEKEDTVTDIDVIAKEIVKNLTIDRKSTASYKRRLKSSTDDRKVSKAFGTLGILLIIATLSLFVLADIFLPSNRKSNKSKKK